MADEANGKPSPRIPTREDLARIARSLNEHGVRYLVIGGMAMVRYGSGRTTRGIDLLVDPAPENVERIRTALSILEDQAVLDVEPDDLVTYTVVRVADEIIVDLLARACGMSYGELHNERETEEIDGVAVPFPSPRGLLRTKQSTRQRV